MSKVKKYIIILCISFGAILITPIIILFIQFHSADMQQPNISINKHDYITESFSSYTKCNNALLKQNSYNLWEIYLQGDAIERGASMGSITKDLMRYQEDVFINQIKEIIPSDKYLSFLKYLLISFNRNLGSYIPKEYREEIYSSSVFCTDSYNAIGNPYERQLNYHAAHDIGHTMQQYMLVGCSSFGVWDEYSNDSSLIIGRNFDFYVGEDFAKNKLISFYNPSQGYKFAAIGWPGMIGVLSGINQMGLTVTINAAKGSIPYSSATPISILTRYILQYASNISQALEIAQEYKTFVSESILIGSAIDGRAAIIEKTPHKTSLYNSVDNKIVCTNHFQSNEFANDEYNVDNIKNSDSFYRWERLGFLIDSLAPLSVTNSAFILRNQKGKNGKDIGFANEKSLNQSIAHHSVIFKPKELKMWVSTNNWQGGDYICYNLNDIFSKMGNSFDEYFSNTLFSNNLTIREDSLYVNYYVPKVKEYRLNIKKIKQAIKDKIILDKHSISNFTTINPNNYYTWRLIGDYYNKIDSIALAKEYYNMALSKEIPYLTERQEIEELINKH